MPTTGPETEGSHTEAREGSHTEASEPSVARNTGLAVVTQVVTAGLTAVLVLYLTRTLGPTAYGVFALAGGMSFVAIFLADLGISPSVGRFIAEHRLDRFAAASFLGAAIPLKLVTSLVTSGVLIILAAPIASAYGNSQLTWPLRGVALALFGQSMMMLFSQALVSVGKISANLRVYTSESVAEVVASVALVALGAGATGAAFGRATGYAVGAAAGFAVIVRVFGRSALALRSPNRRLITEISRYAGVMLIVNGIWTVLSQLSVLLVGALAGSSQVAFLAAPLRLSTLLHYPGLAVQNSVAPRLARRAGGEPDLASFAVALRWLIIIQAATLVPVIAWAGPIIELLLGPSYAASAPVLRALAACVFFQGLGPLVAVGINYLGESRRRVPIALSSLVVLVTVCLILVPSLGARGGAIAESAAYLVYVPAHAVICCRLLGVPVRQFLMTMLRALLAAAAGIGVLALVGTDHLDLIDWLVGGTGGSLAFLGVLFASRELSAAEVAQGYAVVMRRLRPASRA